MAFGSSPRYTGAMPFPPVTIYTTKSCGYCKATKALLTDHNVSFHEIDVGTDREKAREMIELSGQMGVPVIVIGNKDDTETIVGFNKEALASALHLTL